MRLLPTREVFRLIGPKLDPSTCLDEDLTVGFVLSDLGEEHGYTVRRGIGHYRGVGGPEPAVRVRLSRETLEGVLANRTTWAAVLEQGQAEVVGSADVFQRFRSFFDGWNSQ